MKYANYVREIRYRFRDSQIRQAFGQRTHDPMFQRVGNAAQKGLTETEQVWLGFEIIINDRSLPDKYRV
jgi:hypothetical protein